MAFTRCRLRLRRAVAGAIFRSHARGDCESVLDEERGIVLGKDEEIVRSVDRGLLLTGTIGQGLIPTTGDISRGAFGMWIEKGEIAYPVAEITIAGNLGRILKDVEMIGSDLEFRRAVTGPTVKVSEMTVGGL